MKKLLLLKRMEGIVVVVMVLEKGSFFCWDDGAGVAELLERVRCHMGFVRGGNGWQRRFQPGHVIAPVEVGNCIDPSVFNGSHIVSSSSFLLSACDGRSNKSVSISQI